jgi:hypothetical protein
MCEYCGCQSVAAIAQLTSEHDEIRAVAREASHGARAGDHRAAALAARQLLTLLEPHTDVEERGLFPAMAREFPEHVASLEADHQRIETVLEEFASGTTARSGWPARLDSAVADLFLHILREQDGLFPAALTVLTPHQWDALDDMQTAVAQPGTQTR